MRAAVLGARVRAGARRCSDAAASPRRTAARPRRSRDRRASSHRVPAGPRPPPRSAASSASTCTAGILVSRSMRHGQTAASRPRSCSSLLELVQDQLREMAPGGGMRRLRAEVGAGRPARFRHALVEVQRHAGRGVRCSLAIAARADGLGFSVPSRRISGFGTEPRRARAASARARVRCTSGVSRSVGADTGIDRDHVPVETATDRAKLLRFANHASTGHVVQGPHPLERRDRVQPDHAVHVLADVALELAQRGVGRGAVHAVLLAGVEPERVELALQGAHVVSAQERRVDVQGAVSEPEARFDELAPGVGSHDPVDPEASLLPGTRARPPRVSSPNDAAFAHGAQEAELVQPVLDVEDLGALVAESIDLHTCSVRPRRGRGNVTRCASRYRAGSRPWASRRRRARPPGRP